MGEQSLKLLIDANSDQAVAQIKKAIEVVFGLGNATLTVNQEATAAYRQTQAATDALAGATAAAAERVRAGYEAMRGGLDPLYASSKRYESALEMVNAALDAGVIKQGEANAVMAMAEARFLKVGQVASTAGGQVAQMGTQHRNTGFMVQNAAFQISDFAVQVGMGTSAMRAASQQLPQLLGGFGMWGAVIGGAVAVLGALLPVLLNTSDALVDATKANDAFGKTLGALQSDLSAATSLQNEYVQAVVSGNADIIAAVKLEAAAREALLKLDQIAAEDARKTSQQTKDNALIEQQAAQNQVDARTKQIESFKKAGDSNDLVAAQGFLKAEENTLADINKRVAQISAEWDLHNAQLDLTNAKLRINGDILQQIADGTAKIPDGVHNAANAASLLADYFAAAKDALVALVNAQPGAGWLSGAISQAALLRGTLWDALVAADAARTTNPDTPRLPGGVDALASGDINLSQGHVTRRLPVVSSGGVGGSSSARGGIADLGQAGTDALKAMETAIAGVNEKVALGLMSTADSTRAIADAKDKAGNALAELLPQIEAIGTPAAAAFSASWREAIKGMSDGLSRAGQDLSKSLSSDFESAFASFVGGTATGKDAFGSFTQSVMADLAKMATQRFTDKFVTPIFNTILGGLGFAKGGVPDLVPFAAGGMPPLPAFRNSIVERPTFFAMGGARRGVMGEAGSEAIMPLTRGPGGRLGVAAHGGDGGVVVNVINNAGGVKVSQSKRNENGSSIIDVVIDQVKGAVVDDIARGGSIADAMSNTFGLNRRGF